MPNPSAVWEDPRLSSQSQQQYAAPQQQQQYSGSPAPQQGQGQAASYMQGGQQAQGGQIAGQEGDKGLGSMAQGLIGKFSGQQQGQQQMAAQQ